MVRLKAINNKHQKVLELLLPDDAVSQLKKEEVYFQLDEVPPLGEGEVLLTSQVAAFFLMAQEIGLKVEKEEVEYEEGEVGRLQVAEDLL